MEGALFIVVSKQVEAASQSKTAVKEVAIPCAFEKGTIVHLDAQVCAEVVEVEFDLSGKKWGQDWMIRLLVAANADVEALLASDMGWEDHCGHV